MLERREYIKKAEELEDQGKLDEAIKVLRECKENYPEFLVGRLYLARLLFKEKEISGAMDEVNFILERTPDSLGALNLLAEIYMEREEFLKAKDVLLKIKFLSPFNEEVEEKIKQVDEEIVSRIGEDTIKESVPFYEVQSEVEASPGPEGDEDKDIFREEIFEPVQNPETPQIQEQPSVEVTPQEFPEEKFQAEKPEMASPPEVEAKKAEEPVAKEEEEELFYTDTMAQVLLKQGEIEKAEKIYRKLAETGEEKYLQKLKRVRQIGILLKFQEKLKEIGYAGR